MNVQMPITFPVTCHTDFVGPRSTFVAIKGFDRNGADFIPLAIEKGATTIVVDNSYVFPMHIDERIRADGIHVVRTEDTRRALAQLSAQAAGFPAKKLKILGITGTKGKTSTTFFLHHILQTAGHKAALISTIGARIGSVHFPTSLTTPQPDYLHQFLKLCVEQNVEYVVMEVAAQALTLGRVVGIEFDGIIFTNFDYEHLEFYDELADYFRAKCLIFKQTKLNAPCIVNIDHSEGGYLVKTYDVTSLSFEKENADVFGRFDKTADRCLFSLNNERYVSNAQWYGKYNCYNMACAILLAQCLDVQKHHIDTALGTLPLVPGHLETYYIEHKPVIIDYAHNPSSYFALLSSLREKYDYVSVVFGAGGARDALRRPLMGEIASTFADYLVLTTDNPRYENPKDIIDDILKGISTEKRTNVDVELDRAKAISCAVAHILRRPDNAVLAILGKGSDEYQEVRGKKTFFSDREVVLSCVHSE